MKSTRPYLIRAFYEWIVDNNCTPYVVVNAHYKEVEVPQQYIENGQIVLNVSMDAVHELSLGNDAINFMAKFHGVAHSIHIPISAVMAIYASENGKGMVFNEEESFDSENDGDDTDTFNSSIDEEDEEPKSTVSDRKPAATKGKGKRGKSHLTIVK